MYRATSTPHGSNAVTRHRAADQRIKTQKTQLRGEWYEYRKKISCSPDVAHDSAAYYDLGFGIANARGSATRRKRCM
jgi:hypothetical protein